MLRTVLFCSLVVLSGTAWADEPGSAVKQEQTTRIETDQKNGTVKIIVGDQEVARFDAGGLHVRKNVEYGGIVSDTGDDHYVGQTPPPGTIAPAILRH